MIVKVQSAAIPELQVKKQFLLEVGGNFLAARAADNACCCSSTFSCNARKLFFLIIIIFFLDMRYNTKTDRIIGSSNNNI